MLIINYLQLFFNGNVKRIQECGTLAESNKQTHLNT